MAQAARPVPVRGRALAVAEEQLALEEEAPVVVAAPRQAEARRDARFSRISLQGEGSANIYAFNDNKSWLHAQYGRELRRRAVTIGEAR